MNTDRIRDPRLESLVTTAEEAAKLIKDGMTVATSGFTPAGYPKAVPLALAERAKAGEKIGITLLTGASVGPELDAALAEVGVTKRRFPYQTNAIVRDAINRGDIAYADMHLSHLPVWMKNGYFGKIDVAIVECVAVDDKGVYLASSVGIANTAIQLAEKVILEVNNAQPISLIGFHDIYDVEKAPNTQPIPITSAGQRIGTPYVPCSIDKIAAIVETDIRDRTNEVAPIDEVSKQISDNLLGFLRKEIEAGRMPENLFPLQSGVGSVANAVLGGLVNSEFTDLEIYSEVMQDSVLDLIDAGKVKSASATSITLSPSRLPSFYEKIDFYKEKMILRPQELSNNPEVIRRLGLISMNTAIEADIYGNVNSTHVNGGTRLMNGIGGSGDFTRNAGLSIFTTGSTAKGGTLSSIVPQVCHMDHSEHSVMVIVTEQGVADLRGLSPVERAHAIIENCAHPDFKPMLRQYLEEATAESKYLHIPLKVSN